MHDCNKCGTKNILWNTFKLPFKNQHTLMNFPMMSVTSVPPSCPESTEPKLAYFPQTGHMYSVFSTAANTSASASNFLGPFKFYGDAK